MRVPINLGGPRDDLIQCSPYYGNRPFAANHEPAGAGRSPGERKVPVKSKAADRVVAHRGYAALHTENTLAAFNGAARAGCRFVECDLQLTADRVPLLLHDDSLARTFAIDRSVFDVSAGDLIDGENRDGAPGPPTLAAFLAWLASEPGVQAFLELKEESIARFGREVFVAAVRSALHKLRKAGSSPRVVVISFDYDILLPFRDAGIPIGWVLREKTHDALSAAQTLAPEWLFFDIRKAGADTLEEGPWKWCLYEVTGARDVERFRDRGDVYFETMQVAKLRDELCAWDEPA